MTKFQALYVLWLRHESLCGCSWRALAAHYFNRYYFFNGELVPFDKRDDFGICTYNGNQIDGMTLEEEAFKILRPVPNIGEQIDLYECDLTLIDANLKRHINKNKEMKLTEKEIIERLILDIDCLLDTYDINKDDRDLDFFNKLRCSGKYIVYPDNVSELSNEQEEEIRILINKTLDDE